MWQTKTLIIIVIFIIINCQYSGDCYNTTIHKNKGGCEPPSCLKCGQNGCQKCPQLIVHRTRQCVVECPYGHYQRWSTFVDYMGRVCVRNGNLWGVNLNTMAILIGILAGTVLCLIMITIAVIYVKYKHRELMQLATTKQINNETSSDFDDNNSLERRRDFIKQLETLRPYAQNYLDMLNDTRRQLRELYHNGDHNAISVYKPVLRDLAKILLLLNCKSDFRQIPDDWEHLFNWAEQTLKRYKRMSDSSLQQQQQVVQLINFLQSPVLSTDQIDDNHRGSTTVLTTFKPDNLPNHTNNHKNNELPTSINPQWKFEYNLIDNCSPNAVNTAITATTTTTCEFNPQLWKNSKEYLNNCIYLDDDFCQLGFRPQDEITTEL